MKAQLVRRVLVISTVAAVWSLPLAPAAMAQTDSPNQVLEWNQIFIDTLIATSTANSSSQRLGAIVHTAIFDAYNGIERRYTPVHYVGNPEPGASRRAAVIEAAYTTLVGLFSSRVAQLTAARTASLLALSDDGEDGGESRLRGIAWGNEVARAVLEWRANDGFSASRPPFTGGTAIGQWRPIPPATSMSAQGLAFTDLFVVPSVTLFQPDLPRVLTSQEYTDDFNAVKALGRNTGSTRSAEQTALAPFWEGNASVHWNQAANQIARANDLSMSQSNRLLAVLNIAMADTAITIWSAKRFYGGLLPVQVTWRPLTAIQLADQDGNPDTAVDTAWLPLVTTPSHPEYPAGHPSLNGAASTILLSYFGDAQAFRLTTGATARDYTSISQARSDGNEARVWGGMHYPSTVAISDHVGELVADYVNLNSMLPLRGPESVEQNLPAPGQRRR